MSPAPGAEGDPVRQRGIKVFHVGLLRGAFRNTGSTGSLSARSIDGAGKVTSSGSATVNFISAAVPQVQPNNFPDKQRNHNWQVATSGQTLGRDPGTLPIPIRLYGKATDAEAKAASLRAGIMGAGVLSTQQLKAMKFEKPASIQPYNGGLIVQDERRRPAGPEGGQDHRRHHRQGPGRRQGPGAAQPRGCRRRGPLPAYHRLTMRSSARSLWGDENNDESGLAREEGGRGRTKPGKSRGCGLPSVADGAARNNDDSERSQGGFGL